jgi:hypothetical protein
MSKSTHSSQAFRAAAAPAHRTLLGELFAATPLGILLAALKAMRQPVKR